MSGKVKRDQVIKAATLAIDTANDDSAAGLAHFTEAINLARELGDPELLISVLCSATGLLVALGDLSGARERAIEALRISLEQNDQRLIVNIMEIIVDASIAEGDYAPAWDAFDSITAWAKRNKVWTLYESSLRRRATVAHATAQTSIRDAAHAQLLKSAREIRDSAMLNRSLVLAAGAHFEDGNLDEAEKYSRDCLAAARGAGDFDHIAESRTLLAQIATERKDYTAALSHAERAIAIQRERGETDALAETLLVAAKPSIALKKVDQAWQFMDEALEISRQNENHEDFERHLIDQAQVAIVLGDHERARARIDDLVEFARASESLELASALLGRAAYLKSELNDNHLSVLCLLEEALAAAREADAPARLAIALAVLGAAECDAEKWESVESHVREALGIYRELGDRVGAAGCLVLLSRAVAKTRPGDSEAIFMEARKLADEIENDSNRTDDRASPGISSLERGS